MNDLSMRTLITLIRGFSNATTMEGLANKLGISYSTLNRSNKNGKWPRSVAIESMRAVLDECRDKAFDGDGAALAKSTLLQLQGLGIDAQPLAQEFERSGYDGFVTKLIAQAKSYDPQKVLPEPKPEPESEPPNPVPLPPSDGKNNENTRPKIEQRLLVTMMAIPAAIVSLLGLLNISLTSLFDWMTQHQLAFCGISLIIAFLPAILGTLVDAPLAWRTYKRTHPDAQLSLQAYTHVSKFGDVDGIAPGIGRFDLTKTFLIHQSLCNVLGAATYLSLFFLLLALPGFYDFFVSHAWIEFFKASIFVGFYAAYGHIQDQLGVDDEACNPDNFLPTRAHVWANTIHLVWAITLLIVFCFSMIAYGIVMFRMQTIPLQMLLPFGFAMLYFFCACIVPSHLGIPVTCTGIFVPGVIATALGLSALTIACFAPSWEGALSCTIYATSAMGTLAWQRHHANEEWLVTGKHTGVYSIAVATTIAALVVIGILTSAFM